VQTYYVDSEVLKCDTISLDKVFSDYELNGYECIYRDGGYMYMSLSKNSSSRLFAYSVEEDKIVSWTEGTLVWNCGGNRHFIYTNIGIYQKQE